MAGHVAQTPVISFPIRAFSQNGGVLATLDLADYLHETGRYNVRIVSYGSGRRVSPRTDVDIWAPSHMGLARKFPLGLGDAFLRWQKNRIIRRSAKKADLTVVPADWGETLTYSIDAARRAGQHVCCVVHIDLDNKFSAPDNKYHWTKAQTLECYRHVDRIICVSYGIREKLAHDLPEKAGDIVTIQNGVDLERIDRLAREPLPQTIVLPDVPFFMGIGRLAYQKGFDILIKAHARALALGAAAHAVVIVGDGPALAELEQQARELGVAESVHFLGFSDNPFAILTRALALCTSSRFEGFPLSTSEGSALGIPIISTTCPYGPDEILDHGKYGTLVSVEDPESLAQAMLAHLSDPEPLRAKAAASFRDRDRLSSQRCHQRYEAVFSDLLDVSHE